MTTTILAIALAVTLALLTIALVGGRAIRDEQRARIEDLENEVRWLQRRNHPAGRNVIALREALEDRDAGVDGA